MLKEDAQHRADQIAAFRAELEQLAREGVAPLEPARAADLAAHHERLLRQFAREFDVDRGAAGKRMSVGMRLASLLGAAALTAAVVSFVYRVWGALPTTGQVLLLVAAPIAATVGMIVAGRIEKTRYVASLFAIVACGAIVLQTVMLATLFNLRGSPHVLAAWGAFALAVAIPWRFGPPFAFGLLALVVYVPAVGFALSGIPWTYVLQRPEPVAAAALAVMAAAHADAVHARVPRELAAWARAVLLLVVLGTILVLSATGAITLLPVDERVVRVMYQLGAVAAAVVTIAWGLRRGHAEVLAIGALFAAAFMLLRFVDWWWDWMPKYLFFLILAAVALGWLWGLRLARRRLAGSTA